MTVEEFIREFPLAVERDLARIYPPGCVCWERTHGQPELSCTAFHPHSWRETDDLLRALKVKVPDDGDY